MKSFENLPMSLDNLPFKLLLYSTNFPHDLSQALLEKTIEPINVNLQVEVL
jgi:hypothetical protein